MALTAPQGFDVRRLRAAIQTTYEKVASDPSGSFHFHRGAAYAVAQLGYDSLELLVTARAAAGVRATRRASSPAKQSQLAGCAPSRGSQS